LFGSFDDAFWFGVLAGFLEEEEGSERPYEPWDEEDEEGDRPD